MSYNDVVYEDEDLYVIEHNEDEHTLYSAFESATNRPLASNRSTIKEAVKASRKELRGIPELSGREQDIQLAKRHGKRKRLPSGKILPNWLLLLHEETHNRLGHAVRGGWPHGEPSPPHILREEEEVWRETAKVLKSEGKWTPKVREAGIEALGAYYDDTEKARRYVESL